MADAPQQPPLQSLQRAVANTARSVEFFGRTLSIYASFKSTQLRDVVMRLQGGSEAQLADLWKEQHTRAGARMHALCLDLRGFYLKVGSTRMPVGARMRDAST